MADIQAILRQQLRDETARLVARGGPGAFTATERVRLHSEPTEQWWWEPAGAGEAFYPAAAVVAALGYPDLPALAEDWNRLHAERGPLPLYLHATAEGHYTAMLPEGLVLGWLIYCTDMCHEEMLREGER
jgi:hypothetical protein